MKTFIRMVGGMVVVEYFSIFLCYLFEGINDFYVYVENLRAGNGDVVVCV